MEYTIETEEDFKNVHYILDADGIAVFRYVGEVEDLFGLLSHLNKD